MVAFTGVSGSGKSSLAFGTLYAEAQRRYFESVAPYARRLLQQVGAPHVQEITGLPPAVALQQRRGAPSSRSSVGTLTTLSNLVRMLYSRAGTYPDGASRLEAEAFSPNTAAGACPRCHGLGEEHDVSEDLHGAGPLAQHPRGRDRRVAGRLAGRQPAQHRVGPGDRHRQALALAQEEGPRLAALHRRAAQGARQARARPHRPRLPRPLLERTRAHQPRAGHLQEPDDARQGDALRPQRRVPGLPRHRAAGGRARGHLPRDSASRIPTRCRSATWSRCCGR